MKKDNIVLIGMPGVGKSTAGVILAKIMGFNFIDSDLCIQGREKMLLKDIIEKKGVEGFLSIENEVLSKIEIDGAVIATGGSAVYGKEAMAHFKEMGTIIYLKLPYEELTKRLKDIKGRGVVLKEGQSFKDLYDERTVLYEQYADIVIDEFGLSIEDTVAKAAEEFTKY